MNQAVAAKQTQQSLFVTKWLDTNSLFVSLYQIKYLLLVHKMPSGLVSTRTASHDAFVRISLLPVWSEH